jgi:hypothetical protein
VQPLRTLTLKLQRQHAKQGQRETADCKLK